MSLIVQLGLYVFIDVLLAVSGATVIAMPFAIGLALWLAYEVRAEMSRRDERLVRAWLCNQVDGVHPTSRALGIRQ